MLETIVTAAPLMGLLGTITGMMQSFKVIGGAGLVARVLRVHLYLALT